MCLYTWTVEGICVALSLAVMCFAFSYLANDVEEDEEEMKYEIFPWALGKKWKDKYPYFLKKRDKLLRLIDYKAIVSRRCSDEVLFGSIYMYMYI